MVHFTTFEIPPGPAGVDLALRAVHALFEEEHSVALVPAGNVAARAALLETEPLHSDEPTLVLATSGSVSKPRAVELQVGAVAHAAMLSAMYFGREALWLSCLPVTGIGGLNPIIRSALAGAMPLAFPTHPWTAEALSSAVDECVALAKKQGFAAATSLVPTQLHRATQTPGALAALEKLDFVLVGGGRTAPETYELALAAGVNVIRTYGASETCGGVVYEGQPLAGVEVTIENDEISIASETNALCYRDGTPIGSPWRTGDLGSFESGRLSVHGRVDDVIKVAGQRVDLQLLEAAVRRVAGVDEAVACAAADTQYGQVPVIAFTGSADLSEVESAARAELAGARVPLRIHQLSELPLLSNGKPDRGAIAAL